MKEVRNYVAICSQPADAKSRLFYFSKIEKTLLILSLFTMYTFFNTYL